MKVQIWRSLDPSLHESSLKNETRLEGELRAVAVKAYPAPTAESAADPWSRLTLIFVLRGQVVTVHDWQACRPSIGC